jgi:hypothetical protein
MKKLSFFLSTLFFSVSAAAHHSPLEEGTPWLWYLGIATLCVAAFYTYRTRGNQSAAKFFSKRKDKS